MAIEANSKARFNLSKANVLLLDPTTMGQSILAQIFNGFGTGKLYRCSKVDDAREVAANHQLHLSVVDAMSPSGAGYEFVAWLRREAPEPNCFHPVILVEGHTRAVDVARARNCGANFLLKRPLSPLAVMERIIWIGQEDRGFVLGQTYAGPDRRFQDIGPPPSGPRRWNDPKPDPAEENPEPSKTTEIST